MAVSQALALHFRLQQMPLWQLTPLLQLASVGPGWQEPLSQMPEQQSALLLQVWKEQEQSEEHWPARQQLQWLQPGCQGRQP